MVPRGECSFLDKALNLQNARTRDNFPVIAVVIFNTDGADDELVTPEDTGKGRHVRIPVVQVRLQNVHPWLQFMKLNSGEGGMPLIVELGEVL
jgi:hypothetical protein